LSPEAEIIIGKVLAPVLSTVLRRGFKATLDRSRMRRSGLTRSEKHMLQLFNASELESSINHLSFYADLPSGISLRLVENALESLEVQASIKELMAAVLADAPAKLFKGIQRNFEYAFAKQLQPENINDVLPLATKIYQRLSKASREAANKLEGADIETYKELRTSGQLFTMLSTLDSIERHTKSVHKLMADFDLDEQCRQWETQYRGQAASAYGYLEPPDFETKRKVKFEDLYVSPIFAPQRNADPFSYELSLESLIAGIDRTVVLGDPGGGKSTVSRFIAYNFARESDGGTVPFLVVLRNLSLTDEPAQSIVEHIDNRLKSYYQCPSPPGCTESILLSGRALVIFDGLDELLDVTQRKEMTERVEMFAHRYPLARIFVTSRRVGYEQAQLDPNVFTRYELAGFSEENVAVYAEKWFRMTESESDADGTDLARSFIEESSAVPDLRRNPLMLALMCIIYRGENFIPKNRPAVYEKCAGLLFEKWDSSRSIHVELRAADYVDAALKHLAFWMLTSPGDAEGFREAELVDECSRMLRSHFENEIEAGNASREFIEFCRGRAWVFSDAGSTADGEVLYTFTHRTFMEYFAAYHMTRMVDTPEDLGRMLLPRVSNQEWDMVAQLAVQIFNKSRLNGAERVFIYFLADRRRRSLTRRDNMLCFVVRCMVFIPVSQEFAASICARIIALLLDSADVALSQPGGRRLPESSFTSAAALLNIRDEAIAPVQDVLTDKIRELFTNADPASKLTAQFLASEFATLWRYRGFDQEAIVRAPDTRWQEWAHTQFDLYRDRLLGDDSSTSLVYWRLAEEVGYITTDDFIQWTASELGYGLPLDPAFLTARSRIFSGIFYRQIAESIIVGVGWSSTEGLSLSGANIARASALANRMSNQTSPPYVSFAESSRPLTYFPFFPELRIDQVVKEHRWIVMVLILIGLEWWERRRPGFTVLPGERSSKMISPLIAMRQAVRKDPTQGSLALATLDLKGLGLDGREEEMLRQWARGQLNFAAFSD
jgi:hypothetical protein